MTVRGLSAKTAGKVMTTLGRILRYGMFMKAGVKMDFTQQLERTKLSSGELTSDGKLLNEALAHLHEVSEKEVLEPKEIKALILAMTLGLYRTIIHVAVLTGMRISEILALRWSNIDQKESVIYVRNSLSTATIKGYEHLPKIRWFLPKTKRGVRDIPMTPTLEKVFAEWGINGAIKNELDLIFCQDNGTPIDRSGVGKQLKAALKRAEIAKAISPHNLRHTFVSLMIEDNKSDVEGAYLLGDAVDTYKKIYSHFIRRKGKRHTMDGLDRLIEAG